MRLAKSILSFFIVILFAQSAHASHGMGGEITWWCNGTSYVFQLKFYRDCNGIPGPQNLSLQTNVPGISSIPMNLISQTDISPDGSNTSGSSNCPTCPSGGNGAVEEFVFQSNPTVLPGTPPATGWTFWYKSCCRSGALDNVVNGGSYGFALRARMFPYNNFVAGQCNDASPYFAEKPSTIICTGYPFTYNHNAIDPELDSISYSWDILLDDNNNPPNQAVPFAPGYSVISPLPSVNQHPQNQAVTLDPLTGEIEYTSFTQGYFATCIKASAYKCGVLAAEVWREINVVLISGCIIPTFNVPNNPPDVTVIDRKTGFPLPNNSFVVYAGDTVMLRLNALDNDPHPILGVQTVTFSASGSELSNTYTNPNTGCILPPCATTNLALPLSAPFGTQLLFDWQTTCGHLGFDTACTHISNTYNFVIKVSDDYCPANAIDVTTLSLTVTRPPKLDPPEIKCVDVMNLAGDVELTWTPPSPRDTFNTFAQYEIYGATTLAGPWIKMDSIYGSLSDFYTTNLVIPAAKQQTLLGTDAQQQGLYFQMYTRCGCDSDSVSAPSNVARSMYVTTGPQPNGSVDVTWNPVHNPLLSTSNQMYYIWKEFPIGTWTLIDSTQHPNTSYNDLTTQSICDDTLAYRIQTSDTGPPCESWSSHGGIHVVNSAPLAVISPSNPSFCTGGNVTLTANPGGSNYQWSGAATGSGQSILATAPGTYTLTVTYNPGGCTSDTLITVVQNVVPTATLAGTAAICDGDLTNLTITFTGPGPWNYEYNTPAGTSGILSTGTNPLVIPVSPSASFNYTLLSLSNADCPGTIAGNANITVNPLPQATLSGSTAICDGETTGLNIAFSGAPGPFFYTYNPGAVMVGPVGNPATLNVTPAATTNYTLVSVSNALCEGNVAGNANVVVNAIPQAAISGTTDICDGQSTNVSITFSNAPGPYDFTYNPGNVTVLGASSPHVIPVTPGATTSYTLVAVANANCQGTVSGNATVTVHSLPTAALTGTQDICVGESANLNVTFANAPGPYDFTYNPGNITVNGATSPHQLSVTPGATTNYTLVGVSNQWCTGSVSGTATITVNPLPTAQITGTQTICDGDPATLNVTFTGTGPWNYSYLANGNPVGPFNVAASPATINVSPNATTTYTLPPTISDANCTGTGTAGTATVTVTPLPTAAISGTTAICDGQSTSVTINFAGQAPYIYSYLENGNPVGPFNTNNASVSIPVSPTSTTTYTLPVSISGNGCDGTTSGSAVVTVHPLPTAQITGTQTICDGEQATLNITFTGTGPWDYSYMENGTPVGPFTSNTATAVINVTPSATSTYTLPATISDVNCTGTATSGSAVVTVTPLPTASMSGTTAICDGQSTNVTITFNGQAPYTYSYLEGGTLMGPFNTNANSVTIPVSPTTTTTYSLPAVVNGNGCDGTTSGNAVITVHPLPTAVVAGTPEICVGDQATFNITFAGTPPFDYTYSDGTNTFGPFTASANPEVVTVSPSATLTYTVVAVSDDNCTGSASGQATVTVHQLPTAQISGTQTICDGDQANLTINFTGQAPFTYEYTDGISTFGPFNTNNASVTLPVSPSVNTTYTAVMVNDDKCTGTVSGQAIVSVTPLPTATLIGNPVICDGQSTTLTVNFTGVAPFDYSYSDGTNVFGPFTSNNTSVTLNVAPTSTTNYSLTATVTGAGCTGTTSGQSTVTVHPLPTATVVGNSTICDGEQTSFDITFTGNPPYDYTYSDGTTTYGPFNTSSPTETIIVTPSTTTTYTVTVVSDVNCTGSASGQAQVTVNPLPTATLTGTTDICINNNANLSLAFTGTAPFTYSYNDGTTTFGPFVTSNNPASISVAPGNTTTYTALTVSDDNCTGTASGQATVTVHELPTAVISDDSEICFGKPTLFKVTFNGAAPYTYEYTDGTSNYGPFSTSNNPATISVSPGVSTVYSLVSVSDAWCVGSGSGTASVTVNQLPTPAVTGINEICDGESTTFTTGLYVGYQWSNGETTQAININAGGNYVVTVTDGEGCTNTAALLLTVHETPVVSFTHDTSLSCETVAINLINTSSYPAGSMFYWDLGDGEFSSEASPSHIYPDSGFYTVSLAIISQEGCADSTEQQIYVMYYPLPIAEFDLDPREVSVFNSSVQFTDQSQHAVSWFWDFGNGATSYQQNPLVYFDEPGKFFVDLTVTNITGCKDRYREEVYITPFFVPNAFTPNGDGLNETFFNVGYQMDVKSYSMSIFNRWGQKVYENSDIRESWNGTDRSGNAAPQGTYVYAIKVMTRTGKEYYYSGALNLIR